MNKSYENVRQVQGRMQLMVMSMTGFGRGRAEGNNREVNIELKTVNHRYLDISLRMPKSLSMLEEDVRKKIQHTNLGSSQAYTICMMHRINHIRNEYLYSFIYLIHCF
jgi:hypothetical protein